MNHNQKLLHFLTKKSLGHFYHLKLSSFPDKLFFEKWLLPLLWTLLDFPQQTSFSQILNSPDFLSLGQDEDEGFYTLNDLAPLFSFSSSPPWEKRCRVAIIFNAHRLNVLASNKLLKILEEPAPRNILFLVNSRNTVLLPTLLSRAITIRLTDFSSQKEERSFQGLSLASILEMCKENPSLEREYFLWTLKEAQKQNNYPNLEKLLSVSRWAKESQMLKNSPQERLARLYLLNS